MDAYAPEIERKMKRLFDSLSEDDRRRYAAVEATKLGHGGIEYIAQLLQCDPKTIRRGLAELDEAADLDTSRVRKKGGGRKKLIEVSAALEENFLKVLEDHTAGDPMRADVKWTNLSRGEIASRVTELGTQVSRHVVSQLLRKTQVPQAKGIEEEDSHQHGYSPVYPLPLTLSHRGAGTLTWLDAPFDRRRPFRLTGPRPASRVSLPHLPGRTRSALQSTE